MTPTSNACDRQGHFQDTEMTLPALRGALADQDIVVPADRMGQIFLEYNLLRRQRTLINSIVECSELSSIHTVIARAPGTR